MKSVKSRLFLILVLSLGSIITLIFTRYTTSTKTTSIIESTYLIMRLDIRLLNMRRAEKDFINRLDADELRIFDNNYNAFNEDWEAVVPLLKAQNIDHKLLLVLHEDVKKYKLLFDQIADNIITVGMSINEGLRGQGINKIWEVEKFLKDNKKKDMLVTLSELRRNEKNFALRHDPYYIKKVEKLYQQLNDELASYPEIQILLQQYNSTLTEIINIYKTIGLTHKMGLMAELRNNAENTEAHLQLIHDTLLPKLRAAKSHARVQELSIQLITAVVMLIIIMSLVGALRNSFDSFIDFFNNAKTEKTLIPIQDLPYSEFRVMANIGNDMISARFKAEDELHDLNENLEQRVKEATQEIIDLNEEITDTQREVVFTMGAIGESRSKETGNHVKRVAAYSYLFAINCGMPEEEARMLEQASPMHDIGKVGISDAILKKPGKLTDEEFDIMKTHAELGYGMLCHSPRPIFKTASIVANEHHEKWNGKGYPNGTAGEDIHIYGRITALADVFDALGSDRVYKTAWTDEKIFALIKEERGNHFDPKVVDVFFEHLDEFLAIREKYRDQQEKT